MKLSNETKIGVLSAVAITLLIIGFNFLKGKNLFSTGNIIYAKYTDTKGIMVSNPVFANGFQIGSVATISATDKTLSSIVIGIKLTDDYQIPVNSVASISENPLTSASIKISLGDKKEYLKSGDSLITSSSAGLLGEVTNKLGPATDQLKNTLASLDAVLKNVNSIFDPATKNNLQSVISNINQATIRLVTSSQSLQDLLNTQSGSLAKSINNLNDITANIKGNNESITSTIKNLESTSKNLSNADLDGTVEQLKNAFESLSKVIKKVDSKEGSFGMLLNDKALYNNLANTTRSLNILLDDLRVHPKRYINVSVFGKKDKSTPLTAPLNNPTKN